MQSLTPSAVARLDLVIGACAKQAVIPDSTFQASHACRPTSEGSGVLCLNQGREGKRGGGERERVTERERERDRERDRDKRDGAKPDHCPSRQLHAPLASGTTQVTWACDDESARGERGELRR